MGGRNMKKFVYICTKIFVYEKFTTQYNEF